MGLKSWNILAKQLRDYFRFSRKLYVPQFDQVTPQERVRVLGIDFIFQEENVEAIRTLSRVKHYFSLLDDSTVLKIKQAPSMASLKFETNSQSLILSVSIGLEAKFEDISSLIQTLAAAEDDIDTYLVEILNRQPVKNNVTVSSIYSKDFECWEIKSDDQRYSCPAEVSSVEGWIAFLRSDQADSISLAPLWTSVKNTLERF